MSGVHPLWCSGTQRTPLQPRGTPSSPNTMKASDCPVSTANVTSSPPSQCKRLMTDNLPSVGKSENEPLALHNKRQRTKSGSDSLEAAVSCIESVWTNQDCVTGKSDTSPLCEHNMRTSKPEVSDLHGTVENSCICSDKIESKKECCAIDSRVNRTPECISEAQGSMESGECITNGSGGFSPNATLEYVAQLPEGCSGLAEASYSRAIVSSSLDCCSSDDEIDDDDNYLDSSEAEDTINNNNEEEESCGEDDQSVISTVTVGSTCSLRSVASEALNTICINEHGVAANEDGSLLYGCSASAVPLPALNPSMFSHVPPALNFCNYNENTATLPPCVTRWLRWRLTTITPLIVRKAVTNSGFRITRKTAIWNGTWGKHMKSPCFKTIKEFQKVNHFPGTFQIGRKDKLWKNFLRLQSKFGKEEFGFIPKTFVLPGDLNTLKAAFEKEGVKKKWIVKPPASARGTGIQVVNKWSQMPTDSSVVVQRYISRPYLINETKFDMRIYVLVTSFHPLLIFLHQDGLVRFASVQYNKASKTLGDRYMHLTNYSVNKLSSSYTHNEDAGHCQGHKWTLRSLWGYLKARGVDTGALWSRIADLVIKTVISGEFDIVARTRRNMRSRYCCYELFGFDVILDEQLRPWLLEVNISPSLHSASPLDHTVKGPLVADLLNIVAFHIPDRLTQEQQADVLEQLQLGEKVTTLCLDRRLYTRLLTPEEQHKHIKVNAQSRSEYLTSVLEDLTPDDVRHLMLAEDELQRAGGFTRIFPTADTHHYFGFLDHARYYNCLMDAWETSYSTCREKGIEILEGLCKEKYHLKVPAKFKYPKVVSGTKATHRQSATQNEPEEPEGLPSDTASTMEMAKQSHVPKLQKSLPTKRTDRLRHRLRKGSTRPVFVPTKPAIVQNFLNVCSVSRGRDFSSDELAFEEGLFSESESGWKVHDLENLLPVSEKNQLHGTFDAKSELETMVTEDEQQFRNDPCKKESEIRDCELHETVPVDHTKKMLFVTVGSSGDNCTELDEAVKSGIAAEDSDRENANIWQQISHVTTDTESPGEHTQQVIFSTITDDSDLTNSLNADQRNCDIHDSQIHSNVL